MAEKVFVRDIPDELWRAFKAGAAKRGLTVSKAVAEALGRWLKDDGSQKGGFNLRGISSLGASGVADGALNHDWYIAETVADRKSGKARRT